MNSNTSKYNNIRRDRFISEYLIDGKGTESAIRAGYSPRSAQVQASRLLSKDIVQAEIRRKQEVLGRKVEWTLELSSAIAQREFERNIDINPAVAYKYKENRDRLHGLLIERQEQIQVVIDKTRDLTGLNADQLQAELISRLKLSSAGVRTTIKLGSLTDKQESEPVQVEAKVVEKANVLVE